MTQDATGNEVHQQLDQLDSVLSDLREAIMITDSESLLKHSKTMQVVVNQLERHYDGLGDRNTQTNQKVFNRLQQLRRKLVGVGTLLQLSRAKAADLLELMLGANQTPDTYAENGQLSLPGSRVQSLKA